MRQLHFFTINKKLRKNREATKNVAAKEKEAARFEKKKKQQQQQLLPLSSQLMSPIYRVHFFLLPLPLRPLLLLFSPFASQTSTSFTSQAHTRKRHRHHLENWFLDFGIHQKKLFLREIKLFDKREETEIETIVFEGSK